MPRLSIYLPDDLHELARNWRGALNLSAICARALREELEAADNFRAPGALLAHFKGPSDVERALMARFDLADAVVCETPHNSRLLRSSLGDTAAAYLDRTLQDGSAVAFGGGRQTWCVLRSLSPRRLRLQIAALGVAAADPNVLHIHPNTLATLLSVIYSPRSEAHLVGWEGFGGLFPTQDASETDDARYVVVASCGPFSEESGFARLLGSEVAQQLTRAEALGDFGGVFLSEKRTLSIAPRHVQSSLLSGPRLEAISRRADARVLLVGGGPEKLSTMAAALGARLCNVIVTDVKSAETLVAG